MESLGAPDHLIAVLITPSYYITTICLQIRPARPPVIQSRVNVGEDALPGCLVSHIVLQPTATTARKCGDGDGVRLAPNRFHSSCVKTLIVAQCLVKVANSIIDTISAVR